MFLTACDPIILAIEMVANAFNIRISWIDWVKGFAPVGIVLFVLVPILLYKIYPPEIKEAAEAPRWAGEELRKMGAVTRKEIAMLALVLAALAMWIGASRYIDIPIVAILVVVLMVVLQVVTWDDIMKHTQ